MSRRDDVLVPDPFEADDLRALEAALAGTPPVTAEDRAWSELVAMVRDEPPRRDAMAVVSLDHRLSAGFAKPAARKPLPPRPSPWARLRPVLPGIAVLLVLALVVGTAIATGGSPSGNSSSSASTAAAATTAAPASAEAASGSTTSADSASAAAASPPGGQAFDDLNAKAAPPARSGRPTTRALLAGAVGAGSALTAPQAVIRSTRLALSTSASGIQDAADGVVRVTQDEGGIVESSNVSTTSQGGDATFVLRVPSSKLGETVKDLSALAHVKSVSADTQNVTQEAVSDADELRDAEVERDALLASLKVAEQPDHIVQLRQQLERSRREVAQRQTTVDGLAQQTNRARIDVSLTGRGTGRGAAAPAEHARFGPGHALHVAGRVLAVGAGIAIVALAILIPLGLLGGAGTFAGRSARRRRREAALDAA